MHIIITNNNSSETQLFPRPSGLQHL